MNREHKIRPSRGIPATLIFLFIWGVFFAHSATAPINQDVKPGLLQTQTDSLHGMVVDSINLNPIAEANVLCFDEHDSLLTRSVCDAEGLFALAIPKGSYSILVTKIGYLPQKSKTSFTDRGHEVVTVKLNPASTFAGTNQLFKGVLAKSSLNDITLMNKKIALKIENKHSKSDSIHSTVGSLVDFCSVNEADGFGWLNLPIISKKRITGFSGFLLSERLPVQFSTVNIQSTTSDSSVVFTQGKSTELPLDVFNSYSIYPDKDWISVRSTLSNTSNDTIRCWIGDALDNDESGQTTLYPNADASTEVIANRDIFLKDFQPARPWMGCFGSSNQVFGIFYEDEYGKDFDISANTYRIISQKSIVIPPHEKVSFNRKLAAISVAPEQSKNLVISKLYNIVSDPERIETSVATTDTLFLSGKTSTAKVTLKNLSNSLTHENVIVVIKPPFSISTSVDTILVRQILPKQSITLSFDFTPLEGTGNSNITLETKTDVKYMSSAILRLYIPGNGWYSGECHSHSNYSDGLNNIGTNINEAKLKGLSFMHCTDHNTVNQKYAIANVRIKKFLPITGSEVTTLAGHALALFCDEYIRWDSLKESTIKDAQEIIDNINKARGGRPISVICHPYQLGYAWKWTNVVNVKGYEVFNGFNTLRSFETALAFKLWDQKLKEGKRVYGFANSDAHFKEMIGKHRLYVQMDDLSEDELYKSTKAGHFFSSNGPELRFSIDSAQMGDSISLSSDKNVSISMSAYSSESLDSVKLIKNGNIFKAFTFTNGTRKKSIRIIDNASPGDYYRLEVIDKLDQIAFSNPIFIAKSKMLNVDNTLTKNNTLDNTTNPYLYPNPATNAVTVNFCKTASGILSIVDMNGVVRYRTSIENKKELELDVRFLTKGMYVVQLNDLHLKLLVQ